MIFNIHIFMFVFCEDSVTAIINRVVWNAYFIFFLAFFELWGFDWGSQWFVECQILTVPASVWRWT